MKLSEEIIQCHEVHFSDCEGWSESAKKLEQENETLKKELMQIANGGYTGASHIAMVALGLVKS